MMAQAREKHNASTVVYYSGVREEGVLMIA